MAAKSKLKARSREARRHVSPSIDVENSARTASPTGSTATITTKDDDILHMRHEAGITKKKAKLKPMSRQQRLRKAQGFKRAAAVTDQLDKRVGESRGRARKIKERSNDWDQVNTKSGEANARKAERQASKQKKKAALKLSPRTKLTESSTSLPASEEVDAATADTTDITMAE